MSSRLVEVAPERLPGWVHRFSASHGPVRLEEAPDRLLLRAADGEVADLEVAWPPLPAPPRPSSTSAGSGEDDGDVGARVAALAAHAAADRTALLVLVRRGGWAVGLARGGVVLDGVGGTRYVQSRTAAGGWSQRRYARRRANQADGLVGAAVEALARILGEGPSPEVVVPGGDRRLVTDVLSGVPAGARDRLEHLPRGPLLDVPDPRRRVLDEAAVRARCIRVRVASARPRQSDH